MMSRKTKECGGRKGSNLKSWKTETGGSLFGNLRIAYLGEFLSISPRDVKKNIWVPLSLLKERKNSLSVGVSYPGLTRLSTPHVTGCPWLGEGRQSEKNKGSRTLSPAQQMPAEVFFLTSRGTPEATLALLKPQQAREVNHLRVLKVMTDCSHSSSMQTPHAVSNGDTFLPRKMPKGADEGKST